VRAARQANGGADTVLVTIYVNPLQFGAGEDFDRYPRTLDADLEICRAEGADLVFVPPVVHTRAPRVRLSAGPLGECLEGASRPGHFDGMLTLVATMLHLTGADVAYFGQKDAQQLALIRTMVQDLGFPVDICEVPTMRDADGLALSSRNRYLSADERASALALSAALFAARDATAAGRPDSALAEAGAVLDAASQVKVDYLAVVDPDTFENVEQPPGRVLVAARVGATRLIDNLLIQG
jgi:pantoate--beta-alanine ligase